MSIENCDIVKLAELLKPSQQHDDDSEDEDVIGKPTVKAELGPADLAQKSAKSSDEKVKIEKNKKDDESLDPEEEALRLFESENAQLADWRKTPDWDITYRQQVTPNDVFLQMGGKTPSTASCENMVVTVNLPGERRQNVDLKVTCNKLDLISPHFRLNIPLPHPVDPQKGNAQYDSEAEKLIITLHLNREFDYINF